MESNESWARKYRPRNLSEYMGNSVKDVLKNRFSDRNRLPQVVLLQGPRGTGKTTAARLLAKDYLCLEPVDGHACGKCLMCAELDEKLIQTEQGIEPEGVREIDIAAEGQKKNIDDVISEAILPPMYPLKYKILILDEFHMANNAVQNRLLKIMEEPPKHLVIFLCTTNAEKILGTILSRCQVKITVRKAAVDELAERLLFICKQEKVETSMAALRLIAMQADRVPREAITLLEQVALSNGYKVTVEAVQKVTGTVANEVYIRYFKAANTDLEGIMSFVSDLRKSDTSFKDFLNGLTRFTLDCVKIRYAIGIEEFAPEYVKAAKSLFGMYTTEEMDTLLQIIEYANRSLSGDNSDTKEELIITMTAMRIGRVKLLNHGLAGEQAVGERENKASSIKFSQAHNEELLKQNKSVRTGSENAMLATVFGKETVLVTEKPKVLPESTGVGADREEQATEEDDEAFFNKFFNSEES